MTIPVKSNFRYWIPAYLSLLMLAGIGWSTFYRFIQDKVHERHWKRIIFLVMLGIIITHLFAVFNTFPYYFTYYNPLYGGSKRAGNTISIGEGEGLDQAGLYLSSLPHAEDLTVMSWYGWGSFSYYFSGQTITFPVTSSWSTGLANKLRSSDYLVVYQNQWYRRIPAEMFDSLDQVEPIKTIWVDGLEYARIYEVDNLPDQIFNP